MDYITNRSLNHNCRWPLSSVF